MSLGREDSRLDVDPPLLQSICSPAGIGVGVLDTEHHPHHTGVNDGGSAGPGATDVVTGLQGRDHRPAGRAVPRCLQRDHLGVTPARRLGRTFSD